MRFLDLITICIHPGGSVKHWLSAEQRRILITGIPWGNYRGLLNFNFKSDINVFNFCTN